MRRSLLVVTVVAVLAALAACSSATAPQAAGSWGGRQASLTLTAAGGTVSYQCGAGHIDPGWTLDSAGRFSGTGVHYFGGGPVPAPGPTPHPAVYAGVVSGDVFDLTVTVTDLKVTLGPFRMVRGGPPVIQLCV